MTKITNIDTLSALLDRLVSENIKLYFFNKDGILNDIDHQKKVILEILEEYAENESNLSSAVCREQLVDDIVNAISKDSRDVSTKDKRQIEIFD